MEKMKSKLVAYTPNTKIEQFIQGTLWKTEDDNQGNYQEGSKIFRILAAIYLQTKHMPYVFSSKKIKK